MVHTYSLNGYNIALDIESGAVHVLSDEAFALLGLLSPPLPEKCLQEAIESLSGRFSSGGLKEAYAELLTLYRDGLLFSEHSYEDKRDMLSSPAPVKALCLHIAHDCNLVCDYCFASQGDFGGQKKLMPFEVGKAAIDFVVKESGPRKNIEIDYFGGEPLLNFEVVKKITDYARQEGLRNGKEFRFTVTTNGLLLDEEKLSYINENMSNLVLSIDGRKEVNDRVRRRMDGSGCYDKIVPLFQKAAESRKQDRYYVRGTFTRKNLDFSQDVRHLSELGFKQISVEPVVEKETCDFALRKEDLPAIFAEYEKLALDLIDAKKSGRGYNFFHFMIDLTQGPCVVKRLKGCGAGNEYLAVTPEGDLYPCHQFVGDETFKMGNVLAGEFDEEQKRSFSATSVLQKSECRKCWAKYYCSGGCNANNYKFAGDLSVPYALGCELEKKRVECAIMIKAALSDSSI